MLLVHGLGASGRYWRLVAEQLAGELQLIAPDLLGFGRSPWPDIDYQVDDHLDALDGVLEDLEGSERPLLLVGHSLGSILALAWAARRPERFDGMLLLGLPCYRSPQEARRHVAGLGPLAYATVATPRIGAAICGLMCFGRPVWRAVTPLLMPTLPRDVAEDGVLHTWRSYRGTLTHCILDTDTGAIAQRVAASRLPVRLLHGDLDREAPRETVAALAQQAEWQLELVPGAGHGLPIERPRRSAEAVRKLLRQVG